MNLHFAGQFKVPLSRPCLNGLSPQARDTAAQQAPMNVLDAYELAEKFESYGLSKQRVREDGLDYMLFDYGRNTDLAEDVRQELWCRDVTFEELA